MHAPASSSHPQCAGAVSLSLPMPCLSAKLAGTRHVFHLHIAKMAGRTIMGLRSRWFKLPPCDWALAQWYAPVDEDVAVVEGRLVDAIRRNTANGSSRPCFLSQEANWFPLVPAFGATPVLVLTMLRPPIDWALSAAAHWQRSDERCPGIEQSGPCHRNGGLDDLVDSGCFWEAGQFSGKDVTRSCRRRWKNHTLAHPEIPHSACNAKCLGNYGFPWFPLCRLTGKCHMGTRENAEAVVREALSNLDTALVGLTHHHMPSICLLRFQLGLNIATEPCTSLCAPAAPALASHSRLTEQALASEGNQASQLVAGIPTSASLSSLRAVEASMGAYARVYARGVSLFEQRIAVAEHATGITLMCESQGAPKKR